MRNLPTHIPAGAVLDISKSLNIVKIYHPEPKGDSPVTRADTLLQIKDAEVKASQIMKEADDKQRTIVSAARKDAIKRIQDAEAQQRSESEAAYAAEKATVSSQRDEILNKGKAEAKAIKAKADLNLQKAKTQLKLAFEGNI